MAKAKTARFDVDMLREFAGAKTFARGQPYHRSGQVEILLIEPQRVLAQVTGTDEYRTELTGRGDDFDGECSCPAFADRGFCKHLVATALAANELGDEEAEASGTSVSRIREHLRQKGVEALVELVLDLATRDPALLRKLDAAAAPKDVDDKTLGARLRKAIDRATRIPDYVGYGEASDWASQVDSVLDTVAELPSERAAVVIELADFAIKRIVQAIASLDDSDGHCGPLLERASDIRLAATCELRPEPVKLARDLFVREMEDDYGNDLLIRIRIGEKNFDAAWAIVRTQGASMDLKIELAKTSETTHPADALKVYLAQVDALVNSGHGSSYEEAAKLIARMAKLRDKGEHVAYVLELKVRHGRKRNFMKLLA